MQMSSRHKLLSLLMSTLIVMFSPSFVTAQDSPMPFEMSKAGLDVGVVVSDMERARKFYGEALGLKQLPALPIELPGGGAMVRYQSGATVIKLRTFPKAPPPVEIGTMAVNGIRLLTIYVRDIEALAGRFSAAGLPVPKFGERQSAGYRVAFLNDPDGNRIELIAYASDAKPEVWERFQIGLTVSDAGRAREFYGKVLRLREREAVALPANIAPDTMEYFFAAGSTTIKFWAPKGARATRTGAIGAALGIRYITFIVKDVDATHAALKAQGVTITVPPRDLGTIARIMLIADPDGNTIEFASAKSGR